MVVPIQHLMMVAVAHQVEHWIVTPEVAVSRPVGHPTFSDLIHPSFNHARQFLGAGELFKVVG